MADEWDEKARELSKRLRYAFVSNVLDLEDIATFAREAYQRGRNEADTAAERRGIERAAKVADQCAWGNKNTQFLGPEQNCVRVAAAIRALLEKDAANA